MSVRYADVMEGPRDQTLDGEGEFQVIKVYVSGIDAPCSVMISQDQWDAASPESQLLVIRGIRKAVTEVLLLWNVVDACGEDDTNALQRGEKVKD